MLQINSGKLFQNGIGRTNSLRGVLYTNLKLPWQRDVVTAAGTLRETDGGRGSRAIVYELEERIEKSVDGPGILVSHTISPFLQDFSAVASFSLNVIMSPDVALATRLTSGNPGLASYHSPREFIRRCFDEQVYLQESEADEFASFVDQLLGLERRTFLGVMRAIRTYVTGVHRITDDLGLAYTLMVSALESMAQDFDGYESTWQDVDERKRNPIDKALRRTPEQTARGIREAILSVEHVSLGRRYREFALAHVDESYFRAGDALIGRPLARYELEEALRQAYGFRSKYVHNLHVLPDKLTLPFGHWESTYVNRQPALTFQGISRLTRHVIKSFIESCPTVTREVYNYGHEQAGVTMVRLAPEFWVARPLKDAKHARQRLEGFLQQLVPILGGAPDAKLTDLRSVLGDIERLLPRAAKTHRPAMLVLHAMFNATVGPALRTEGHSELLERYSVEVIKPLPETLVARTIFQTTTVWSVEDHKTAHDAYFKQRSRPNGLHAPRQIDAAISLELAERYRQDGRVEEAKALISTAVENHPNHRALLELEKIFTRSVVIDWKATIFPPSPEQATTSQTT